MCGAEPTSEFNVDDVSALTAENLKKRLESNNWIVEFNGDKFDTYCSEKCAKGEP